MLKKICYSVCTVLVICAIWIIHTQNQDTQNSVSLYDSLSEQQYTKESSSPQKTDDVQKGNGKPIVNQWLSDLKVQNSELIGWISIEDSSINYPVMQTKEDNDYYLNHDFEQNPDRHGTPFLDVSCDPNQNNLIIYGHNMADGTMFHDLLNYKYTDYCENHNTITFSTLYETKKFDLVAVILLSEEDTKTFRYYEYSKFENENDYKAFFDSCYSYKMWMMESIPEYSESVIMLSTCDSSKENGRLVVIGIET